MMEIYWLTRFDDILFLLFILIACGITFMLVSGVCYLGADKPIQVTKAANCFIVGTIFTILMTVVYAFVPTTQDAFVIYGVGGNIDYLKNHEKIKELPIEYQYCLDALVEQFKKENQ